MQSESVGTCLTTPDWAGSYRWLLETTAGDGSVALNLIVGGISGSGIGGAGIGAADLKPNQLRDGAPLGSSKTTKVPCGR